MADRADLEQWKSKLTPEQFTVCWKGGTEPPFSGQHLHEHRKGTFVCTCCQQPLFSSISKFDSGSGWPSFWQAVNNQAIRYLSDSSHGMTRTEVRCQQCDAHLGHVFEDGPEPTGKRYCINSLSLEFIADTE